MTRGQVDNTAVLQFEESFQLSQVCVQVRVTDAAVALLAALRTVGDVDVVG